MRVLTHPFFVVLCFCCVIISGEQMGGIYLFYILLGLPHLVLHSVFGVLGIALLLIAYRHHLKRTFFLRVAGAVFMRVAGAVFMIASLLYFFLQQNGSYNYNTFHELLPVSTLIIFTVVVTIFIFKNLFVTFNASDKPRRVS